MFIDFSLDTSKLLLSIQNAIKEKRPLSIVRVGDGENLLLAQYCVLPEEEFMKTDVARKWPRHPAGVKFPDIKARDQVVSALKKVDIVGILPYDDDRILAPSEYKRPLTEKVFSHHNINPSATFDAYIFRDLLSDSNFWNTLHSTNIVLISKWADKFIDHCAPLSLKWNIHFVKSVTISNYYEVTRVLKELKSIKFDVALIAAGVGAIVLSQKIAENYGKIGIDVGQGLSRVAEGHIKLPV